ncbi:tryptophan--tRNA ligase [Candidatus Odyssella acanthamoebae]|uniref:Tryptophan--tRNA ligase n=1 Tax=Candidatus Odyssella acanthamoebae TaxID=91604 RepID=A0A077AVB7_9PROT|nr:tryptophan--tRNA ligase [Candidatus Paracaedibacter acanthamoebae]AIK95588.1 tryptophanyl-tRNA synthetase [Candidatus Paracaedibacter acanthamoebae]
MQRILSGVRPTGGIHLGNYLGAIRNWVSMQHQAQESLFCIVDMHALTTLGETESLAENTYAIAAAYLAAGIDLNKASIFAQSHVAAHTELSWIFSCITPLGWLNRMTQFKEKAGKHKDLACLGLYAYPVLMAADILLYKATHVPVGDDQKQHLELARDIAGAFNRRFGDDLFPIPEPMILGSATRVMSLRDGSSKMSKSDISEYSRIELMDNADALALKIRKARTDMEPLPEKFSDLEGRPEAQNLVNIYATLANMAPDAVCQQFVGSNFAPFKQQLVDLMVATIVPIGDKMRQYLADKVMLQKVLTAGARRANELAQSHMQDVRRAIGMVAL